MGVVQYNKEMPGGKDITYVCDVMTNASLGNPYNRLQKLVTDVSTVLESPGKPVTGSPSILKGCHNSLIEGSPSIIVSPVG